ncbi:MAG: cell division protein FtsQ/DivIB [Oxalobacter formigenes]|nr:cell division protein FtsQ/DivIB [Oxalobacter formigenes]
MWWHDVRLLNTVTRVLLALFAAIVLAGCFSWLAQQPFFTLKVIQVQEADGNELRHVNAMTIRGIALPRIKGHFFSVDLEAVREAFKAVPWVREVTVRRKWPDGLLVFLEEHRPLGVWGRDGQLLSVKGDVFTANLAEAEEEVNLLKFYGPEGSEKEVAVRYGELKQGLAAIRLEPVVLELSDRYAWRAVLNNGVMLRFGRQEEPVSMREQTARLLAAYPRLSAQLKNGIRVIDLRYPNGLALTADNLMPGPGIQ